MMNRMMNTLRGEAQRAAATKSPPRRGTITAYNPAKYEAKVLIQPEGFETGFLPIGAAWVGSGCGLFLGPSIGDEVEVNFQEGGKNAAYIGDRFFGNLAPPLTVPSGEAWLVHKSGSYTKLTNDGKVSLRDAAGSTLVLNNDGTSILTSNLIVNGYITATGDITDRNITGGSSMAHFRNVYDTHTHGDVQGGSDNTAIPNQEL